MGYRIFGQKITGIRDIKTPPNGASTVKSNLYAKKLFVFALLVMNMLLLDCDSDVGRKRTVGKEFIAKAQWCLDTLRNKYWSEMALVDRV